jgi:ABC-type amino acid transport system permease subunit
MLIEIIRNTPRWVFVLFIVLLVMGYQQSKNRTASRLSVGILPMVFLILAFYGVVSAFGTDPVGLVLWALGV